MEKPVLTPAQKSAQEMSMWSALSLAWELGYMIAVPAVVFGFAGAYLDKTFHTSPLLIIIGFVTALVISFISIKRRIRTILQ